MTESGLIAALEAEYEPRSGFLGLLRSGQFDEERLERLLDLLSEIRLGAAPTVERRLVSLLWMIPTLMTWQIDRVAATGGNVEKLRRGIDRVQAILDDVLGTP